MRGPERVPPNYPCPIGMRRVGFGDPGSVFLSVVLTWDSLEAPFPVLNPGPACRSPSRLKALAFKLGGSGGEDLPDQAILSGPVIRATLRFFDKLIPYFLSAE